MKKLIGKTLDRYKILALLGEGGMGAVFRARDIALQRDVAIKIMHGHYARQTDFRARFLQEARTAARLDHPGIVRVHDFKQTSTQLYIVMELIPGDNLRQTLQDLRAKRLWIPLRESIQLVHEVAVAVHYAHQHGILHRDVKPENIMLKPDPTNGLTCRPILTDLGLAKLAGAAPVTQEGVSMGTPAYMSPEQALGERTDARSDVYTLGILLYELAAGQLPYPAKTISDAIRYHVRTPLPPPRSLNPDLPEPVERVIQKALEKSPENRFSTASALATALESLVQDVAKATTASAYEEGLTSLFTQYQASLAKPRGNSVLGEFSPASASFTGDRVQILFPDRTTTSVALSNGELNLGRATDNVLVLDRPGVSRHHAEIQFDGSNYRVLDLNSTNGTYLSNVKLLPGVSEVWAPDKALRVGDLWLRLQRSDPKASTGENSFGSGRPSMQGSQLHSSGGTGRIGVFMEPGQLSVTPGSSTTASLVLFNQAEEVDRFTVSVRGVPLAWITGMPPAVDLMPGQQHEVSLTIQPPPSPASRAGRYSLEIRVTSQDAPGEVARVRRTLTVAPYTLYSIDVQPQRMRSGKSAQVMVQNQGNTPETFELTWQDRANELVFDPPQARLTVPEGKSASAEFRASPRKPRWIGGEKTHPISTSVRLREAIQTQAGEVVSKGVIPAWVLPALVFLCMVMAAAAAFTGNEIAQRDARATQTAEARVLATQTALVMADMDGDGLSDVKERELGTDPSKTDSDGDGLGDGKELNDYGTDPTLPDTDGDGLWDGDEIRWNANPLAIDSDGDTLSDGEEVNNLGTSPILTDTDGDGELDNVDKDPGTLPTPIPPTPEPDAPTIKSFKVSPSLLAKGFVDTLRVTWEVDSADTVTIMPSPGLLGPTTGSLDIPAPSADTIYTLVAKGPGGESSATAQVRVGEAQCTVVSKELNLRSGPGTNYEPPITAMSRGTKLEPLAFFANGYPEPGWIQVAVLGTGEQGWVRAKDQYVSCNVNAGDLPSAGTVSPPDSEGPQVTVSHYPDNPSSSEQIRFTASATDEQGVQRIEILVQGQVVKVCSESPCSHDEGAHSPGTISYQARAYDLAGNQGSDSGTVEVRKETVQASAKLVAYYPFNGNADDASGAGNDGAAAGAVLTEDRHYSANRAYQFNGHDAVIQIPDHQNLHIPERISLAAWVYPTAQKTQEIIRKGAGVNGSTAAPYALSLSAIGDIIFSLRLDGQWTQVKKSGYELNRWFLVVGTYDGASMKLYVDGNLVGNLAASGTMNANSSALFVGTRLRLPSDTFKGKIDEVRVYDGALTPNEVRDLSMK